MRIHFIRFKNINSLAGEWTINFRDPAYLSTGIFAITGSMGAGKSTVLDAITLALYGQTPRLGKITKGTDEIMSRQTGECFAEVEFSSDRGTYRCMWSQKRAHTKSDGVLLPPKHEISDAATGTVLKSKLTDVPHEVAVVTGLDYQQFTRSILLAQGEFGTFLDAKADERAPILEKITGTEIYGRISSKVHERFGKEKTALDTLSGKADTLEMISPEQAVSLQQGKEQHEHDIREITARCKGLEDAVVWLDTIAKLETEITNLKKRAVTLETRRNEAADNLSRLHLARKARDLEGRYSALISFREQQAQELNERKGYEERLSKLSSSFISALETFRLAEDHHKKASEEKQREDEIIRHVRELDSQTREIMVRRNERTEEKRQLYENIGNYQEAIRSAEIRSDEIRKNLEPVTRYLEEHTLDEKLIADFSGIASTIRQIHVAEDGEENKKKNLRKIEHEIADAEEVVLRRKHELDTASKKIQNAIDTANRIKKELEDITDGRDGTTLWRIAEEDANRQHQLQSLMEILVRIEEDIVERQEIIRGLESDTTKRAEEAQCYDALQKEAEIAAKLVQISEENLRNLARIKNLEEERQALVDGEPCPLCGSTDHPWCKGTVPIPSDAEKKHDSYKRENEELQKKVRKSEAGFARLDEKIRAAKDMLRDRENKAKKMVENLKSECQILGITFETEPKPAISVALEECATRLDAVRKIISESEQKERDLKRVEETHYKEKDAHADLQRNFDNLLMYRDTKFGDHERLTKEIVTVGEDIKKQKAALLESVQNYDILVYSTPTMLEDILAALTKRRDEYVTSRDRRQELQERLRQCESDLDKNRSFLSVAEKSQADLSGILTKIEKDFSDLLAQRKTLYGEKDPAAEEARVARMAKEAEKAFSDATATKNLLDKQKTACEEHIQALAGKISARTSVLAGQEQQFSDACTGAGFSSEEEFLSARLAPNRLNELEALEADITREVTEITAGLKDRTGKLESERKRGLTKENREDLVLAIENDKNCITRLQLEIGGIRTNLEHYDEQVKKQRELTEEIAKQRKEFAKWERLHALIGSADGKKFRVFAQGLTFETLIVHANRHLRAMSDRYLLIRNKESPLDLDIVDNDQAGEIRTTKNLSGGERFIVSLALALGLSGMASHNIRIDSLFLDEGFGTLDPETLETALETLSSLQREGKIIGIISHVPALKERIPVQIQIEKIGGGRSRLTGPGCSGPM